MFRRRFTQALLALGMPVMLVLAVAGPATAAPVNPPAGYRANSLILDSGSAQTVSVTVPGATASYTFAGTSGQHVTFDVSASSWGGGTATVNLYNPSNAYFSYFSIGTGATYGDFTLNATGTWTVVFDPYSTATGSATFTYAVDIAGGALVSQIPVLATIGLRGQDERYTFSATTGQHVTFDASTTNWGGGSARFDLYNPSGAYFSYFSMSTAATYGDFTLNATGTWTAVLNPYSSSTGSATITYATDIPGGPLSPGDTAITEIGIRGQDMRFTFGGTTGQHVTFDASSTNWGGGSARFDLYNPSGTYFSYFAMSTAATYGDFVLNATGTWTAVLNPYSSSTGSATITYATDIAGGSLTSGVPVTTAIGTRGQDARFTFTGSVGEHITFDASATDWGGGSARFDLYNPSGAYFSYFAMSTAATYGDFVLNAAGIWTAVLNPYSSSTGHATITYATDVIGGGLTSTVPFTTTIPIRGQDARFTFSGTNGQHVTFDASSTNWGTGSARLDLYNPSGTYFSYFAMSTAATFGDFTLNATGTWTAVLNPYSSSTGSATITYATDINGGALTPLSAKTTSIDIRGRNASFTFSATSGQTVTFAVPATSWIGGSAQLQLYNPSGNYFSYMGLGNSPTSGSFTLNATGTWTVLLNPYSASTGSATFSYS